MSCINHEIKSIFIHIPKCGGSSMAAVSWNKGSGHKTLRSFSKTKNFDSYFKWCFVRNPWDRAVSAWDTCPEIKPITFQKFIETIHAKKHRIQNLPHLTWSTLPKLDLPVNRIHFMPMIPLIKVNGQVSMNFCGRFENLEKDWKKLTHHLGVENKLVHHNERKEKKPYQEYYNNDLKEMVWEIYKEDIEYFDYKFDNSV